MHLHPLQEFKMERVAKFLSSQETTTTPNQCLSQPTVPEK